MFKDPDGKSNLNLVKATYDCGVASLNMSSISN